MSIADQQKRPKAADVAGGCLILCVFAAEAVIDVSAPAWLATLAVALLLLVPPFVFLPFRMLSRHGRPPEGGPFFATTRVVDKGVYRIVRHPQYVGYTLLALGFGARNPHPVVLGLAAGAAGFFYLQALMEERYCRREWGPTYEAYMRQVPRFNFLAGLFRVLRKRLTRVRS